MPKYFKSLKFKLLSLVLLGMVSLVMGLFFYVLPVYEDHLFEKRKEQVKSAVEVAFGTLDTVQANVAAGRIPKENIAKEVQKIFEALRYSKTEYFFAYDKKGINTAHGTKLSAVGKNRYEDKDPNGFYYIQAFLSYMGKEEGGYVYYQFDDGKGGKPQDKVSFIKYYKPLDWVIGSGVTIKGVQDEMAAIRLKVLVGVGFITLIAFSVSWMYSNRICNQIDQISHDLFNEADKVAGVAINISKASEILSSSTTQQASALQQTSSSIEETSAMITKNADNAKASMTISLKSQSSVEQGKKYVNEMIFSIQEISDSNVEMVKQIDESNKEIAEIVKVINEIGSKTKVINDIVFQTKLLSFNASVEAARAGEHGKGFAVVAEEIGNLAQMSGNSAKEISELLENSIHTVQKTIDSSKERITRIVASGDAKVKNSGSIAKRCEEIFDEIVINVNQVNEMVGEIAVASNEQATGVREINSAVTELDSAGQQNTVMSQKTSEYAGELRDQVVELRKNTSALTVLIKGEDDENAA